MIRNIIFVALASFTTLFGCATPDYNYIHINDSESYWQRSGFSIKPPSGSYWVKLPINDAWPNAITFMKGEGVGWLGASSPNKWIYLKYYMAMAVSTLLDEPIINRSDKSNVEQVLRNHLDRYHTSLKIVNASYDDKIGTDCLKYSGKARNARFMAEQTDMLEGDVKGYFCLHPQNDFFGVVMESHNSATASTKITNKDEQVDHFFKSLQFQPIPTSAPRYFTMSHYQVGKGPYQLTRYKKKVWVALKDENKLVEVDPANGKVTESVAVGQQPISVMSGENAIWVANSGEAKVMRIDPQTAKVVATIPVPGKPVSISVGRGGVWVACPTENAIVRIDPINNAVVATITVGKEPVSVNVGKDGIWAANAGDGTISLIDPAHNWPINTIQVGGRPIRVSLADSGAWIADETSTSVVRIERKTRSVTAKIDVGAKPRWIFSVDGGDVFVALADVAKVVRIDPALNRPFGAPITLEAAPRSLMYLDGYLWVANGDGSSLTQVKLNPEGQIAGLGYKSER